MPLITVRNLSLAYGHHPLLEQANFTLEPGDRACLIGRNGSGKSSLLKLIAGQGVPDGGEIHIDPGVRVAYLSQEPTLDENATVFENVAAGLGELRQLILDYHATTRALADGEGDLDANLARLQGLQEQLEARDGWRLTQRVEQVMTRLGLPEDTPATALSGGWRRRVALGAALVADPQVLLLDEPTNHLDIAAIEWLEDLVKGFRGALLFVTHDRAFLEHLATRILELDRGTLREFAGNYQSYQRHKAEQLAAEASQNAEFDKHLAEEERWIRRGIEARRTRNMGRVRSLIALRAERSQRRERDGAARLSLDGGAQSGKLVLEAEHLSFGWNGKPIVTDLNLRVLRGDRIGLVGPNGVGKTTLLKLLLGQLQPTGGSLKQGTRLEVAYFDQTRARLDPEARVVDCVGEGKETVTIGGKTRHVMGYLGDFLFPPERARSPVKSLSGGERARLLLAQLFARPANVLVMDEPTNDLDIETLELLEELLMDYPGTLFMVSHDRAFLDNVVTSCLAFEGNGVVREYVGGYSDWLRQRIAPPAAGATPVAATPAPAPPAGAAARPAAAVRKLSFKENRELEELPARIEALEREQTEVQGRLADPALYRDQPAVARDLNARLTALADDLARGYARWEELEALRSGG